jgi:hypothetical protein
MWNGRTLLPAQTLCPVFENAVVLAKLLLLPRCTAMTGDQSRTLGVGDRVSWKASATDLGTVVETTWSGVTINWDDGRTTSILHSDMKRVERVPMQV